MCDWKIGEASGVAERTTSDPLPLTPYGFSRGAKKQSNFTK